MRYQLFALLITAFSLSLPRPEPAIDGATLCSIDPVPQRYPPGSLLLTRASPDTVLTGPGAVLPGFAGGHAGAGGQGSIFGQLFEVARFAGADSVRLANVFRTRGDTHVAIVPWDFDPACQPVRWTRGVSWVPIGSSGTFTVMLRADSLWLNGMPVFDAFAAAFAPYPVGRLLSVVRSAEFRTDDQLTAAEYFDLLTVLPSLSLLKEQPDSAWQIFVSWQKANPRIAQLWPANEVAAKLASLVRLMKSERVSR